MKRVLITGGAGGIATAIRPLLRADYTLRLSDRRPIANVADGEEIAEARLLNAAEVRTAVAGVDAIVHLGAYPTERDFQTVLNSNIIGTYNVFEAARLEGVLRIVFASSAHAVGFYRRSETIPANVTPRPDTLYGLSKVFGEGLGSLYADKYGFDVLSIRIGHFTATPMDARSLSIWVSPRDLAQLIRIGIETPQLGHQIVYGVSDNKRAFWDNANAVRLGYQPQDRADDYATEILARGPAETGDPRVDLNQGGEYCLPREGQDSPAKK